MIDVEVYHPLEGLDNTAVMGMGCKNEFLVCAKTMEGTNAVMNAGASLFFVSLTSIRKHPRWICHVELLKRFKPSKGKEFHGTRRKATLVDTFFEFF